MAAVDTDPRPMLRHRRWRTTPRRAPARVDDVVFVHDPDDQPYWAWTTSDTQMRVGLTDRPETAPGPRVVDGTSWVVIVRDADGLPVASSPRRPVAP